MKRASGDSESGTRSSKQRRPLRFDGRGLELIAGLQRRPVVMIHRSFACAAEFIAAALRHDVPPVKWAWRAAKQTCCPPLSLVVGPVESRITSSSELAADSIFWLGTAAHGGAELDRSDQFIDVPMTTRCPPGGLYGVVRPPGDDLKDAILILRSSTSGLS